MGRPQKQGLEYFSLDVSFYRDIKMRKLIRRKGSQSLTVYTILLCIIYENGYYINWDDDIPFIIFEATGIEEDTIKDIILYCVELGLFDQRLFDTESVLTSHGIQQRYFIACSLLKRKVSKDLPYIIYPSSPSSSDESVKKEVSSEKTYISSEETIVNSEETHVSSEETTDNKSFLQNIPGKSAQKKRKENKDIDSSLRSESPSSLPTTVKGEEINFLAFMEFFNGTMQHYSSQIPTITQITPKRRQALAARAREHGKEALRTAVINAATAQFLNGASDKPFVANFDWIFRPTNFVKVLEGNYNHDITNPNTTYHATGNNNGYRTSEDLRQGAARIIARMSAAAEQPEEKLPVV